jgi:sugar phosphate permease
MSAAPPPHDPQYLPPEAHVWRMKILVSTYLAYCGFYLTRKTFTYSNTTIAAEFDWGLDVTGHIWATFLFSYMIGQFIHSFLGRKYGPRVLLLGGLGLSIVCNMIFGFANSYATFMVFMFFNGLFQAAGWPGCVGGVAEWLRPSERGLFMGFWSTNYLVGNLVSKAVAGYLLGVYGWRWSFWGLTLLSVLIWLLVYWWQRNRPEDVGLAPIVEQAPTKDLRTVRAAESEHIGLRQYLRLAFNPFILMMGMSYFCIKFLRYALDSWLPTFLNLQGMNVANSAISSGLFDVMGLAGAILAGYALDRVFKGNWAGLCLLISLGMILAYGLLFVFGTSPFWIVLLTGFIGLMVYGPDTILAGAAAVQVAGEKNGVAVAGLVNGIASLGPVVQEGVISWLVRDDPIQGMHNANLMGFGMSIIFFFFMLIMLWRYLKTHRGYREAEAGGS